MYRNVLQKLKTWRHQKNRKPLILNGVRQCGKTTSLLEFGRQEFDRFHYFNFEKQAKLHKIFDQDHDLEPSQLLNDLSFHVDAPINAQTDLVIFDEIQACPRALTSLKYFCEEMPQLALVAAGSLLGVHLNHDSFPVGKVDLLPMYPMSFSEFLIAMKEERSLEAMDRALETRKLSESIHVHIWGLLKQYFVTGGLPEVVREYVDNQENLVTAMIAVREKQETLIKNYYADIAKHSGKINAMHIDRVWHSVPEQLARAQDEASSRFRFKDILPTSSRYSRLTHVIDWLQAAHHIIRLPIVDHIEIPLSAYAKEGRFKLFMFDCGLLGAMSGINPKTILEYDYGTYKGYFAENFVIQELLCAGIDDLYSWKEGRAELEFVFDWNGSIVPIEVKSGKVTQSKSLSAYAEKYKPSQRAILSAKNLCFQQQDALLMLPIYMASMLTGYLL